MTVTPRRSRTSGSDGVRDAADIWFVTRFDSMTRRLTIRVTDDLLAWLREASRRTGVPISRLIRWRLENAKANGGEPRFMRHVGAISGPAPDLSSRKGFSRR